jgi:hypothetical protein
MYHFGVFTAAMGGLARAWMRFTYGIFVDAYLVRLVSPSRDRVKARDGSKEECLVSSHVYLYCGIVF